MNITSLTLKNFKSHTDQKIEFTPGLNLISGNLGSGKTSILEAIRFATLGKTEYDSEYYISTGKTEAIVSIEITIKDKHILTTKTISKNGRVSTSGASTADILKALNTTSVAMESLLNTWQYIPDVQEKAISSLLTSNISADTIISELQKDTTSDTENEFIRQFVTENTSGVKIKKAMTQHLLTRITSTRREYRKQLQINQEKVNKLQEKLQETSQFPIDEDTRQRTFQYNVLSRDIATAQSIVTKKTQEITLANTRIQDLKEILKEIESTTCRGASKEALTERINKATLQLGAIQSAIRGLENTIEILRKHESAENLPCPYGDTCKAPKKLGNIEELLTSITKKIETKQSDEALTDAEITQAQDDIMILDKVLEVSNDISSIASKVDIVAKTLSETNKTIIDNTQQMNVLKSQGIITDTASADNYANISSEVQTTTTTIDLLTKNIDISARIESALNDSHRWTSLFGNKSDALSSIIIAATNKMLGGENIIEISEDFDNITINNVPYFMLSESQRMRVGIAVQIACAIISNIKIIVIDNTDMITDQECLNNIYNTISDLDMAIITSSIKNTYPSANNIEIRKT